MVLSKDVADGRRGSAVVVVAGHRLVVVRHIAYAVGLGGGILAFILVRLLAVASGEVVSIGLCALGILFVVVHVAISSKSRREDAPWNMLAVFREDN